MTRRWPPSDFSGRGGRCGVQATAPRNSARPSRSSLSSDSAVAATPIDWMSPRSIGRRSRFGRSNCGSGNDTASPSSPSARASSGEASISLGVEVYFACGASEKPALGASASAPSPRSVARLPRLRGRVWGRGLRGLRSPASTSAPYARRKNPRAGPMNCPAAACSPGPRSDARGSLRDPGIEQLLQRGRDRRERLARRLGARRARGVLAFLRVRGISPWAEYGPAECGEGRAGETVSAACVSSR